MNFTRFLVDNWSSLLSIIISIIVFIIALVKKRPVSNLWDREINDLMFMIPSFIQEAETKFQYGEDKMKFVLNKIESYLNCIIVPEEQKADRDAYLSIFKSYIENILSTPRKKKD